MRGNNRANGLAILVQQFPVGLSAVLVDVLLQRGCREIAGCRVDIDKARSRADSRDAGGRGKETVGCCEHRIAGPDFESHQSGQQRIGSG